MKIFRLSFHINQFIKEIFIYGIGNMIFLLVPIVITPFLTRVFTVNQYGAIDLIYTTVLIISMIATLCLDTALLRFYYDDKDKKEIIITSVFMFSFISSLVFCMLSFLFFITFKGAIFKTPEEINALFIALLSIPFTVILTNELMLLRIQRKAFIFVLLSTSNLVISLPLIIFLVKYTTLGIRAVFVATGISQSMLSLIGIFYLRKNFTFSSISLNINKKMLFYSIPLLVPSLVGTFLGNINKYFLQFYHGLSSVAIYGVGLKISMVIGLVVMSFRQAWIPYAFSIMDKEGSREKYNFVFKGFLTLLFILAMLTIIFAKQLILIISNKNYLDAKSVIGYICLGTIFINLSGNFFNLGIHAKKNTVYSLFSYIAGFLINIILAIILVPKYSIIGAGLAMVGGHFVIAMLLFYFSNKVYKIHYDLKLLFAVIALYLFFLFLFGVNT